MNAEYYRHKQVWQMLKPRMDAQVDSTEPLAWAPPPTVGLLPEVIGWYAAGMDLAVRTHGLTELASPLSEW